MGFNLVAPSTRGISLALSKHILSKTTLPLLATHRSPIFEATTISSAATDISRIYLLKLDFHNEESIRNAAAKAHDILLDNHKIENMIISPGILYPERKLEDLDYGQVLETFKTNIIGPMFMLKHFTPLLSPTSKTMIFAARVGSVSDNRLGGWFSYRTSKAAVFQLVKTFNVYLRQKKLGFCIGYHPGTVKTDLSKDFWNSSKGIMKDVDEAAACAWEVLNGRTEREHSGRVFDWKGEEILP
ncbi:unnamed protein product [Didymodactylos carnosus]|uniref:Uncharacterized protein n=1 Tax=Didymodactylos carnosus TaxID=1234261 RepID=A0A816BM28_9BILA|nr:unnamed protein product [Didymodactylos carnosus]CAF4492705.1 unnamed protein product [Didymodactylos carnosus]